MEKTRWNSRMLAYDMHKWYNLETRGNFDTSFKAWLILKRHFASKSRARIIQIKEELQNLKKRGMSIFEFILKIKAFTNDLLAAACPIFEEEKPVYVLGGVQFLRKRNRYMC